MRTMQTLRRPGVLAVVLLASTAAFAAPPKTRQTAFRHRVELRRAVVTPTLTPSRPRTSALHKFNLQPAGYTPYDPYLGPVRRVLRNVNSRPRSLAEACKLLRVAHGFRYVTRDRYRADLPSLTAAKRSGDCKAKALWLYDRLGDTSALYVIGKVRSNSRTAHAWLYWRWDGRWWILDPTNLKAPIAADTLSASRYVPYYSFNAAGAYRHPATHLTLFAKHGSISVVAERKSR